MRTVRVGSSQVDVPWTLTDRLASWWNPATGMERLRSRLMMSAAVGDYKGGRRDSRSLRNWRPFQTSANEGLAQDLPDLRARSRDAERNQPIATGVINTVVTSVVGDGLVLQPQIDREVLGLTQDQAEAKQREFYREFMTFWRNPDFCGRQNFDGLLPLVFRSVLVSGDLLVVRRRRFDRGDTYGLKLHLVEADRLSNPSRRANSPNLIDGVELDSDGVPVAYHIATRHPDDYASGQKLEWKRYEKGSSATGTPQILHLYHQLRPDQARGIPFLAPVIEAMKVLGDYTDAELRATLVSSMFTVFVEHENIGDPSDPIIGAASGTTSADAKTELELGSGAVVDLAQGEKANFANPTRPNTAFDGFVTAVARQIGVGLEIPYELLLKSFTASYSASRAALEMAWQMFRTRRSWLAWNFCQPVYEWVITEAVASGRLSAPGFFTDAVIRDAWLGSDWIGPARIQLDPYKEASADLIDVNMGSKTIQQVCLERTGGDFEQKHAQRVREHRMREADGLATPASASEALQPKDSRATKKQNAGGEEDEDT